VSSNFLFTAKRPTRSSVPFLYSAVLLQWFQDWDHNDDKQDRAAGISMEDIALEKQGHAYVDVFGF
jgi:hypothetical protein